jgi:hypothetical protein
VTDLATPQDVARVYGKSVGYVYKLASVHRWARLKHDGRVFYRWSDADRVLGSDASCVSA